LEAAVHRIVKAHLESFVKSFGLDAEDEASQFEKFTTRAVISSRFPSPYELEDVSTGPSKDGIDGVAVVIDEEVCVSVEDAENSFSTGRRNHDVDVIFVQAKRSENFDLGDFLKFKEAVLRFTSQTPYECKDEVLQNARQIFDKVVQEVPKIRNGKPSLTARFVATGVYREPDALEAALRDSKAQID
jgi:hypothetical protein